MNSFLGRLLISNLFILGGVLICLFIWNVFLCFPILPNFQFFIYVCLRDWLYLLTWRSGFLLGSLEVYALGMPPMWAAWSFCCGSLKVYFGWFARHAWPLVQSGCPALPCVDAASHWLVGPVHHMAGYRTLGVPEYRQCRLIGG